jgi:hypothetical protein
MARPNRLAHREQRDRFLLLHGAGATIRDAMEAAGCSERMVIVWLDDPDFQEQLERLRSTTTTTVPKAA